MNSAETANVENKKERTEKERECHRLYQIKYYHTKSKLKVVCELCGSKTTAKNLGKHKRTPKCNNLSGGRQETFKDRVEKLERVFGELTLQKVDELVCLLYRCHPSIWCPKPSGNARLTQHECSHGEHPECTG